MQDLLTEYKQTKKFLSSESEELRRKINVLSGRSLDTTVLESQRQGISEMTSDVDYIIEWLETGRRPGNKRGVERRAAYQREKLMDPIRMQAFVANSTAGSPANLTDSQRFMLEEAMQDLSPRERECYELAHGHGFSHEYIAELLTITKGSVDTLVHRAQQKISDRLLNSLFLVG